MSRTLTIVETDGNVLSSQVNAALKVAGITVLGDTTSYDMDEMRTGESEQHYRPPYICRCCGWVYNNGDDNDDSPNADYCCDCMEGFACPSCGGCSSEECKACGGTGIIPPGGEMPEQP